ncbi:MAG: transcription termination/antitermination protein NusG [Candidatus Omnitrophica bacterium]|nr:transcription termination/antitermination protein NusG [Candidatus Omnitrophota bacterium]
MSQWYILHVRTGQENKIRSLIESRINELSEKESKQIKQIIIPMEEVSDTLSGEKKIKERRYLPGYLLMETEENVDETVWHRIKTTPGVFGTLGAGVKPAPLESSEITRLLKELEERKSKPIPKVEFSKNDKVEIIDGPFMNFTGIIEEVNHEKERLKVSVSIFGRSTILDMSFWQVEKV